MTTRLWLSVAALALGVALLAAAPFAGAASSTPVAKGGTMKLNMSNTDVDFTDPSLAYSITAWQIEYATALKLYNYPDKPRPEGSRLQPEAAAGFPVISKDGKTYTITVPRGLRFSDGKPVTAANFAFAINRALNPAMASPAATFIQDIVGAQAVRDGKAKTASGVRVKGNTLTIKLTQADGGLLAKLGMPFFQAIETSLPADPKGVLVYPSAGPYHIVSRDIGRQIVVKKNPFYTGPRPRNVDTFVITVNTNVDQSLLQVRANQADFDMSGLPPTAHADLAGRYGINKGRYQVHPMVETDYIALNTSRAPFSSVKLRKAVNYAIDRPAMLRTRGLYAGKRTDQILPPGMGGFRNAHIYPIQGPNYAKARQLAGDTCKTLTLWSMNSPVGEAIAQVIKYNLAQIGCDVEIKLFQGYQLLPAAGQKGADYDLILLGFIQDYPDPYDFLDVLLNGNNIQEKSNNNLAYFDVASVNKQLEDANRLTGDARYEAYGKLDVLITSKYAPWAAYDNRNSRDFVASRVGGYVFQPANAMADLNTFFLK